MLVGGAAVARMRRPMISIAVRGTLRAVTPSVRKPVPAPGAP
jgi:hypothetical protein